MIKASTNLKIAIRFILSRKRAMAMSLAGIMFGVGFFIITQAQTTGFEEFYIETIIGSDSPMRIEDRLEQNIMRTLPASTNSSFRIASTGGQKYVSGIEYPALLKKALQEFDSVIAVSEVVRGNVQISSHFNDENARIHGIRIEDHLQVTNLASQIRVGSIEDFNLKTNSILIGIKLAERLDLRPGQTVTIEAKGDRNTYQVAGIFETGIEDIDKRRVFTHIDEARTILKKPFGGALFQVNIDNVKKAPEIAEHIQSTLRHRTISWQEREKTWLEVFSVLRISSAITVSSIILISGLGMFNTLAMIVMEKRKEIAILRSMGYSRRDIRSIFLWQGSIILLIGTLLGWLFGAGATFGIANLPIRIRGIFSTDHFVVNWDIMHYVYATLVAIVVVYVASLIPAKRAARVEPGQVIRGASD